MLTPKQERFCLEYVKDLNGTQSGIRAGYSKKTSGQQAEALLKKPEIKNRVSQLQNKIAKKLNITAEMIASEFARIGFSNIQNYITEGNGIVSLKKIDASKARVVESIKTVVTESEFGSTTTTTFKLHDKIKALENLAKHIGFFETDNRQKGERIKITRKKTNGG